MAFTKVATVQEVQPGKGKKVVVNGCPVALFHIDGGWFAINDTCTHVGGPLSEGQVNGKEVTCPWHRARFDVTTGANLCPPARTAVASYKVQVVGDEVQVDVG